MVVGGRVKNGRVVLDDPNGLPDGTEVEVRPKKTRKPAGKPRKPKAKSLLDRLGTVVGSIEDLPADAAGNVDHYLYGHPKK